MGMKNPGAAKTPCRFCLIRATMSKAQRHYYVPHEQVQPMTLNLRENTRQTIEDVMIIGGERPAEFGK
jgi:hypothetical protein